MRAKETDIADADARALIGDSIGEFDADALADFSFEGNDASVGDGESLPARDAARFNRDAFLNCVQAKRGETAVIAGEIGLSFACFEPHAAQIAEREEVVDHELFRPRSDERDAIR